MKVRPQRHTEQTGPLQYWSREDSQDSTTLSDLDCVAESRNALTRRPLAIGAEAWKAKTLDQWDRLRVMATLLDDRTDSNRDAKCHRTRYVEKSDVAIARSARGTWTTKGLIQCGRMTCPICGVRRARYVASMIGACITNHRNHEELASDVWMLTLAPPHHAEDPLATSLERLYEAAAQFFRSAAWRRFAVEYEIVARIRVLDATHGGSNGSHPHFHIALFPRAAWMLTSWFPDEESSTCAVSDVARRHREEREFEAQNPEFTDNMIKALTAWDERPAQPPRTPNVFDFIQPLRSRPKRERALYLKHVSRELVPAWRAACERAGVPVANVAAFDKHALKLSPSEDAAAYFTRWGLADEVASSPQKHRSHLRLLDLCAAGGVDGDRAADIYRAFREAVHGRAWVSGLADACTRLGVHDEDGTLYLDELHAKRERIMARAGAPVEERAPLELVIRAYLYPAALRVGWVEVFSFCDELADHGANTLDVQSALDAMLWRNLGERRSQQGPPSFAGEN